MESSFHHSDESSYALFSPLSLSPPTRHSSLSNLEGPQHRTEFIYRPHTSSITGIGTDTANNAARQLNGLASDSSNHSNAVENTWKVLSGDRIRHSASRPLPNMDGHRLEVDGTKQGTSLASDGCGSKRAPAANPPALTPSPLTVSAHDIEPGSLDFTELATGLGEISSSSRSESVASVAASTPLRHAETLTRGADPTGSIFSAGSPAGSVRVRVSSSKLREISSPLVSPAGSRAEGGRGRVGDRVLRDVTPYALTPLRGGGGGGGDDGDLGRVSNSTAQIGTSSHGGLQQGVLQNTCEEFSHTEDSLLVDSSGGSTLAKQHLLQHQPKASAAKSALQFPHVVHLIDPPLHPPTSHSLHPPTSHSLHPPTSHSLHPPIVTTSHPHTVTAPHSLHPPTVITSHPHTVTAPHSLHPPAYSRSPVKAALSCFPDTAKTSQSDQSCVSELGGMLALPADNEVEFHPGTLATETAPPPLSSHPVAPGQSVASEERGVPSTTDFCLRSNRLPLCAGGSNEQRHDQSDRRGWRPSFEVPTCHAPSRGLDLEATAQLATVCAAAAIAAAASVASKPNNKPVCNSSASPPPLPPPSPPPRSFVPNQVNTRASSSRSKPQPSLAKYGKERLGPLVPKYGKETHIPPVPKYGSSSRDEAGKAKMVVATDSRHRGGEQTGLCHGRRKRAVCPRGRKYAGRHMRLGSPEPKWPDPSPPPTPGEADDWNEPPLSYVPTARRTVWGPKVTGNETCHDHHRSVEVPTPPLSNHVPLLDTVELVLAHQVEKGASLQAAATEADAWREEGGRAKEVEEVF